jgi:hypothetical protein
VRFLVYKKPSHDHHYSYQDYATNIASTFSENTRRVYIAITIPVIVQLPEKGVDRGEGLGNLLVLLSETLQYPVLVNHSRN